MPLFEIHNIVSMMSATSLSNGTFSPSPMSPRNQADATVSSPQRPGTATSTSTTASQELPSPLSPWPEQTPSRSIYGSRRTRMAEHEANKRYRRNGSESSVRDKSPSARPMSSGTTGMEADERKKLKQKASVTPRRFRKFFAPRSHGPVPFSPRGPGLHNLGPSPINSRNGIQSSPIRQVSKRGEKENDVDTCGGDSKRRRIEKSSARLKVDSGCSWASDIHGSVSSDNKLSVLPLNECTFDVPSSPCERSLRRSNIAETIAARPLSPIRRRVDDRGLSGQLRGLQLRATPGRQRMVYPDYRNETEAFYSKSTDIHYSAGLQGPHRVVPFCTASLNSCSLTAIGDEEGRVRLLESAEGEKKGFSEVFLGFQVHTNAIIDMSFSEDDSRLATASGDQTARVVDMQTQTTISILGLHAASLKQIRFQPGVNNNNILATSSRDGCIQIWDLRCKGEAGPTQVLRGINAGPPGISPSWSRPIHSIIGAHEPKYTSRASLALAGNDIPKKGEVPGRLRDISVTCMSFLSREHLLVTGSESDASIRLWDLRSLQNKPNKMQIPVSQTAHPASHSQWRHFGTTSINVSGDGSRLYSLCKDNTVYVYSTAHLVLGDSPELSRTDSARRLPPKETKRGLGPIYGYRHPSLYASTFYVKSALRKANCGKSEMLAVGSHDGCVILFPTDENYFPRYVPGEDSESSPDAGLRRDSRRPGTEKDAKRPEETIPISTNGTALIRGHDKEAGSLSWTSEGNLISVADDFLVRCWRDGGDAARDLRMGGETEGRRWGCGWADVGEDFDESE